MSPIHYMRSTISYSTYCAVHTLCYLSSRAYLRALQSVPHRLKWVLSFSLMISYSCIYIIALHYLGTVLPNLVCCTSTEHATLLLQENRTYKYSRRSGISRSTAKDPRDNTLGWRVQSKVAIRSGFAIWLWFGLISCFDLIWSDYMMFENY